MADAGLPAQRGDHKPRLPLSKRAPCCGMKIGRNALRNWCGSAEPAVWPQGSATSANQMVLYGRQSNIQLLNEDDVGLELTERAGLP